jgi:hypothetical protein
MVLQLLVYAYNVHILGESIHTIQKNTEPSVAASKEIGLEVLIKLSIRSYLKIRMDEFTL